MQVSHVTSVAIVQVDFVVGTIERNGHGRNTLVSDQNRKFWLYLPKSAARQLAVGDKLFVLCIPASGIISSECTLAVSIKRPEKGFTEPLWNAGDYWAKLYNTYAMIGSTE